MKDLPDVPFEMRARLEEELRFVQLELKDMKTFREIPSLLKDLHFHPGIMADRIIISLQKSLKKSGFNLKNYTLRMEWVIEMKKKFEHNTHFAFMLHKETEGHLCEVINESTVMPAYMTPSWSSGIPDILNAHRVSEAYTFKFPFTSIPEIEIIRSVEVGNYQAVSAEEIPKTTSSKHPMFYQDDVIRYYLQWADEVIRTTYCEQNKKWNKELPIPPITDEAFEERWQLHRQKLEKHLTNVFNKVIQENCAGETILAIIFHSPDEMNIKNDPFVILEFIEVKYSTFVKGRIAKTLETTGQIIDPSKFMPMQNTRSEEVKH